MELLLFLRHYDGPFVCDNNQIVRPTDEGCNGQSAQDF